MLGVLAAMPVLLRPASARAETAPLTSWNDGPAKQAILDFVKTTTDRANADYVPPEDRIAAFDQDGTLWVEHPLYTQAFFALDRVHEMAPKHPEWKSREPFKAVLANDLPALAHFSERDWAEIVFVTHAGMSQAEFLDIATKWLATAKHPRFKRPFTELVYQPMIEVLDYLRANQFATYIVTGGGQDFVRAYSQQVYGIPTQNVIGSSLVEKYEFKDGKTELLRLPKLFFDDNYGGKAVGIDTVHRQARHRRLRQLHRRPADARIHQGRQRRPAVDAGAARRRRSASSPMGRRRVCRTPRLARSPQALYNEANKERLAGHQHEERLEADLCRPKHKTGRITSRRLTESPERTKQ